MIDIKNLTVKVTEAPYNAKGDGITNDRAAIQQAIDDVFAQGGGTVVLTEGKTFLSSSLVLRSNIEFHFEDGATLYQISDPNEYVKPVGDGYEPYKPMYGHNVVPGIKWSHAWYFNYPMLFAAEGTHDVKITGNGTIKMMPDDEPDKILRICPIGFYRVKNFEVSDITITDYHSYGMMIYTCNDGLFKNIKIHKNSHGNGDGIGLMNCQNIRVTGCKMFTGDDSVYIFVSYKDPRGGGWWSSEEPQPSMNIEIDHNDLASNHCKAFGMILWGAECPDQRKVEVRNVYVHDNHFLSMGNWNMNPYTKKEIYYPPVTNFRFENNKIDTIEENFFETQISDINDISFSDDYILIGGFTKEGEYHIDMLDKNFSNSKNIVTEDFVSTISIYDSESIIACVSTEDGHNYLKKYSLSGEELETIDLSSKLGFSEMVIWDMYVSEDGSIVLETSTDSVEDAFCVLDKEYDVISDSFDFDIIRLNDDVVLSGGKIVGKDEYNNIIFSNISEFGEIFLYRYDF